MSTPTRFPAILVLCLIGLRIQSPMFAQTAGTTELDQPLRVILGTAPDTLVSGGSLLVTILVEYPQAAEVSCLPPAFPQALVLRGVRLEPELVPGVSGAERWTRLEYQFDLREAGNYLLGSFAIKAGSRTAETAVMDLAILPASTTQAEPVLYWSNVPASFTAGTPIILELRASGFALQDDPVIEADVPENALLESLKPKEGDGHRNGSALVVARFRLTPLAAGLLRLPQASIRTANGDRVRIRPAEFSRTYRVGVAPSSTADPRGAGTVPSLASKPGDPAMGNLEPDPEEPKFPEAGFASILPAFMRASAEAAVAESRQAWARHDYPTALSILRKTERDTIAGWTVRSLRAGSEQVLGLPAAFDEPYSPRIPLVVLACAAVLVAVGAIFFPLKRHFTGNRADQAADPGCTGGKKDSVTIFRSRGFFVASLCACIALAAMMRLAYAGVAAGQRVVLVPYTAFRVPDPQSVPVASFTGGECVRSGSRAGMWLYVESVDGRAGWIDSGFARKY